MRILITGVAGFLGSHLADRMLVRGHTVVGVDTLIGGYRDNVPEGVEFHQVDCLHFDEMKKVMQGCEVVIHCAATAYEGLSVFSPHIVTQNIFGATTGTLSAALACNVRRFVLCSSMARYGTQQIPFTEDMTPKPQDPYGIAKVAAEQVLMNLATTHGMDWVIAVPHNIIGPRQKYDDPFRNVASIMINRVLRGKPPIIYGDGTQVRCFSFVGDVIDPLEKLALGDVSKEIINVGPDEEFVTINQLYQVIQELTGFTEPAIYMPGRPQEVREATCSSNKARELLGYQTTTSLKEGLQSIIDYITLRGTKEFDYHLPLEFTTDTTPKTWSQKLM